MDEAPRQRESLTGSILEVNLWKHGKSLVTTAIVKITKKPVNPKIEGYIHGVGMVLLLTLMAVILFKDVFFLFK